MEEATPLTEFKVISRKCPGYSSAGTWQMGNCGEGSTLHLNCKHGGHDDVEEI